MIISTGKIIVTEPLVTVTEFHFGECGPIAPGQTSLDVAGIEAIDWAIERLKRAREEAVNGTGVQDGLNFHVQKEP